MSNEISIRVEQKGNWIIVSSSDGDKINNIERRFRNVRPAVDYISNLWEMRKLGYKVGIGGAVSARFLRTLSKEGIVV